MTSNTIAEALRAAAHVLDPSSPDVHEIRANRAIAVLDAVTEPECYSHTRPINHIRQALMILRGEAG